MDQRLLGGRYELRRHIGAGGMADVCLALDRSLGREVAVKVLRPEYAADPSFVARFKREAQAAAALNHPNVVAIYDWGTDNGTYYLVMEYVPGPNLEEVHRQRGPLPEAEALALAAQIAAALEDAHRHGIVHRDVKPHNVLLDVDGQAKVTDFGIARAADTGQQTQTIGLLGSAHYLSPEQALAQRVDARSDLYSLGVLLYELLAGRVPFGGDTPVAAALQHVRDEPVPPHQVRAGLSPYGEAVALRALAKDPAHRYQTAAEMRAALVQARSHVVAASVAATQQISVATLASGQAARDAGGEVRIQAPGDSTIAAGPKPPPELAAQRSRSSVSARRQPGAWLAALLGVVLLSIGAGAYTLVRTTGLLATANGGRAAPEVQGAAAARSPVPAGTRAVAPSPAAPSTTADSGAAPAAPSTAVPPRPSATPSPLSQGSGVPSPAQAVARFYQLLAQRQFDSAAGLWSPRMRAAFPPPIYIADRFAQTQQLSVRRAEVVALDEAAGRATVAVDVLEVAGSPPTTRRWVGAWQVVRGEEGWLLDQPSLQSAQSTQQAGILNVRAERTGGDGPGGRHGDVGAGAQREKEGRSDDKPPGKHRGREARTQYIGRG